MNLQEAVALLSEFEHRGFQTWILSKSKTFHRGELSEKNILVVPDPAESGGVNGFALTQFEAIAIASALQRELCEASVEISGDDVRRG